MIKNLGLGLVVIVVVLGAILLFTLLAALIPLGTAWLLLFITPLTFFEASVLNSTILMLIIFATQRDLDLDVASIAVQALIFMPVISLILNAVTWILQRFISLSYQETLLVVSLTTLPMFYALYLSIYREAVKSGSQDDEDEDEYDYDEDEEDDEDDYYEDEEEDLRPKIHFRKKQSKQRSPEDIIEELRKAALKANDVCYCGSGKKFSRCHGRKSWR